MSANPERVRSLITSNAADWFMANRAGLSAREREAFGEWLRASSMHVEEYLAIAVVARDLNLASAVPWDSLERLVEEARRDAEPTVARISQSASVRSWRSAAMAVAALCVLGSGLLLWWHLRPVEDGLASKEMTVLHFETRHGEQQTHQLADHSVLHLNTDTTVTVRYGKTERLVILGSGEADIAVAHERDRPFRVLAGLAEVLDLGTRFDVRLTEGSTVVTVAEGQVSVGLSATSAAGGASAGPGRAAPTVRLGANQQVVVTEGDWPVAPVTVDAQRSTAWLHRQISFRHEPLERVAREFNRYSRTPIEITTPALRKLEISGVFSIDDIDAFVAFLRTLDGVHVDVTATRIVVSQD